MKFEDVKGRLEGATINQETFFRSLQENIKQKVQFSMGESAEVDPISFLTNLLEEIQNNDNTHLYGGLLHATTDLLNELTH